MVEYHRKLRIFGTKKIDTVHGLIYTFYFGCNKNKHNIPKI